MKIVCYGDSNTYGYDPKPGLGGRYTADCRWVDILAEKTGWEIKNQGRNGREIPDHPIKIPQDTDMLIVMLGSNDLLQGGSVRMITKCMEDFLNSLEIDKEKIMLIAPPPMKLGDWVPTQELADLSVQLIPSYASLAENMGIKFAASGEWEIPLAYDGVHFTPEGHKAFAEGLFNYLHKGE